jgi:hypothetical protein
MANPNPRPAYDKQGGLVRLYFKGSPEQKDEQGNVTRPEHPAESVEMYPIDANEALRRDPDLWSREPWGEQEAEADPGDESRQSAHGGSEEEIYQNEEMHAMRKDGLAAEPAGSTAGTRPGAVSPSRAPRRAPTTLVDAARDKTQGPGNDPKPGDTNIAANRRRGGLTPGPEDQTLG